MDDDLIDDDDEGFQLFPSAGANPLGGLYQRLSERLHGGSPELGEAFTFGRTVALGENVAAPARYGGGLAQPEWSSSLRGASPSHSGFSFAASPDHPSSGGEEKEQQGAVPSSSTSQARQFTRVRTSFSASFRSGTSSGANSSVLVNKSSNQNSLAPCGEEDETKEPGGEPVVLAEAQELAANVRCEDPNHVQRAFVYEDRGGGPPSQQRDDVAPEYQTLSADKMFSQSAIYDDSVVSLSNERTFAASPELPRERSAAEKLLSDRVGGPPPRRVRDITSTDCVRVDSSTSEQESVESSRPDAEEGASRVNSGASGSSPAIGVCSDLWSEDSSSATSAWRGAVKCGSPANGTITDVYDGSRRSLVLSDLVSADEQVGRLADFCHHTLADVFIFRNKHVAPRVSPHASDFSVINSESS